jgi:hypothetical protein
VVNVPEQHPVELELNASAKDILDAISAGFRAKIDVKGKLAELYLARQLETLRASGSIARFEWNDVDGRPDFTVLIGGKEIVVECKNVRSPTKDELKRPRERWKPRVELQKTRNSKDGAQTRGYRIDEFDVLCVSLFNQTGRWEYVHALTADLARRPEDPERLVIMQPVPLQLSDVWKGSLLDVLNAAASTKREHGAGSKKP